MKCSYLYFHAGARSKFYRGQAAFAADEGDMDAAGGHQLVAFLKAVAVFFFFLCFLALWTDKEEIEHGYHQDYHDGSFPAVSNVKKYEFCHFVFSLIIMMPKKRPPLFFIA